MSEENTQTSPIWFTHKEYRYDAELKGTQKVIKFTKFQKWNWINCFVSWIKISDTKIKFVIRSANNVNSKYRNKKVTLNYMLGFDVDKMTNFDLIEDNYAEPLDNLSESYGIKRKRWVIRLDEDHEIWQWKEDGKIKENSEIFKIMTAILRSLEEPVSISSKNFFNVNANDYNDNKIIPVVYQPAIDSWKNFIREIHCHKKDHDNKKIEVTILFNNEQLREHALANGIYEWFRSWFYGRKIDIESFDIISYDEHPENFDFPNIYSGNNDVQQDDIHQKLNIRIKYYFGNIKHPIVFVNTSNHAMAEHDNNDKLWKWEYTAWDNDSPIFFGEKSRNELERSFKAKLKFW